MNYIPSVGAIPNIGNILFVNKLRKNKLNLTLFQPQSFPPKFIQRKHLF